jgi:hypothetical protein
MPGFYIAAWAAAEQVPQGTKNRIGCVSVVANNGAEAEGMVWQWLRENYPPGQYFNHVVAVNEFTSRARAFVAANPE